MTPSVLPSVANQLMSRNPKWSDTEDRYLLKLFRDFVFHQVDEDGDPVVEYGHVINALNKLDAGVPEKTILTSRSEDSMLVVRSVLVLERGLENERVREGLLATLLAMLS